MTRQDRNARTVLVDFQPVRMLTESTLIDDLGSGGLVRRVLRRAVRGDLLSIEHPNLWTEVMNLSMSKQARL